MHSTATAITSLRKLSGNRDEGLDAVDSGARGLRLDPAPGGRLRAVLREFAHRAGRGELVLHVPEEPADEIGRGHGHFHLAAELFLQSSGWTRFRFPRSELLVEPGQALLMPPRLLHAERVGPAGEAPFENVVIYADGARLTCHLAREVRRGHPGIVHLESSRHPQVVRIQDWLADAARPVPPRADGGEFAALALAQRRALVTAAAAGTLRALDDVDPGASPEPMLAARVRMLVQNQLGDPALSVMSLARQCGCTADHLSHVFSRAAGERLAAYIVRQRMERAARLLADSRMAGKEIAWACGFASASYFTRSFRAHFGLTPRAWRAARGASA